MVLYYGSIMALNYGYSMWFYFRLLFNIYPFLCSYDTSISVMLFWVVCAFLTMSTSLAILGQLVNVDVLEVLCRIGFKKVDSRDTGCVQSYFVYSPHTLILCSLLMSFRQRSWKVAIFFSCIYLWEWVWYQIQIIFHIYVIIL